MNRTSLAIRGLSESELRGPRVRILSGRWAGQEGHLMDGDYGFDGRCVKLDPHAPRWAGHLCRGATRQLPTPGM